MTTSLAITVTLAISRDSDDSNSAEGAPPAKQTDAVATFTIDAGAARFKATYFDIAGLSAATWKKFCDAVEARTFAKVTLCRSNGTVGFVTEEGRVMFEVSKYGAGGDGGLCALVPGESCKDAFKQLHEFLTAAAAAATAVQH